MTTTLTKYNAAYTAYTYDGRTGYLIANNVGAPVNNAGAFILATASSNPVIYASANYISANALLQDFTASVPYDVGVNMNIVAKYYTDQTTTLTTCNVNVALVPVSSPTAMPTVMPSAVPTIYPTAAPTFVNTAVVNIVESVSTDDDVAQTGKKASITAAVLAAILIVLVLIVLVLFFQNKNRAPEPAPVKEIAMNPMTSSQA